MKKLLLVVILVSLAGCATAPKEKIILTLPADVKYSDK